MPKAHEKTFNTPIGGIMDVMRGNSDAFVYDAAYNKIFYETRGRKKLTLLDQKFTYEPQAWGIRKGDPDFLNWLNNFLRQIKHDGVYARLYKKWFVNVKSWIKRIKRR